MTLPTARPALLVVNDDPASLLGLTALLERWSPELNYEIVSANSGEVALREVLSREFAAILLDVNMPGMDGYETAEIIHARPASASIPILFITAYWSDELARVKAYQNGAVDYLFTPIVPEILRAKVSVFVSLAQKNIELREQAGLLERRSNQLEHMNDLLREEIAGRVEAERRDREKDEFLAMLGHELRNPLAAITNAADILCAKNGGSTEFAASVIQRQSAALNGIVDDLLNLGRVLYGKVSLDLKVMDVAEVTQSCMKTFELSGRTASWSIKTALSQAPARIDLIRFEQIVGNLIDNALKFTPKGGVIEVKAAVCDESTMLEVSDNGYGIEPDLLPRIFDAFVQGSKFRSSAIDAEGDGNRERELEGGLGIGLALTRQLVQMHGGTIEATSDGPGKGSSFIVRLPAAQPIQQDKKADPERPLDGRTILLADDNDDVRETLALVLESYGCSVLTAHDGPSALTILEQQIPKLALIDISMPGMDGYEVARRARANPATAGLRLVALTGYGTDSVARQIGEAGFDGHVTKPVRIDTLLALFNEDDVSLRQSQN